MSQFRILQPSSSGSKSPRLGCLSIQRVIGSTLIDISTPASWTSTTRGAVSHLTRDHVNSTRAIRGLHIPFESYLEASTPVPTLQLGPLPLHTFLGFSPSDHVLSFGLRDPCDAQPMHANTNAFVVASTVRGAKKVSPTQYNSYASTLQPDIVFSLPDIPYTNPTYSQKRHTKSINRTLLWLTELLIHRSTINPESANLGIVFAHLLGGSIIPARLAFADALLERIEEPYATRLPNLETLDAGIGGYVLDLAPIRHSPPTAKPPTPEDITPLIDASLERLSVEKPRLMTAVSSPHEILHHLLHSGIDLFDSAWAQRAADWGVALDFEFPVPPSTTDLPLEVERRQIGHNLYEQQFAYDFTPILSSSPSSLLSSQSRSCPCITCSPVFHPSTIRHSPHDALSLPVIDETNDTVPSVPHTRAYLHHLLLTHEMSAHAMLVAHNLTVVDTFFAGIRQVLSDGQGDQERLKSEVQRFTDIYVDVASGGPEGNIFEEGKRLWKEVDLARGKGRIRREKEKELTKGAGVVGTDA